MSRIKRHKIKSVRHNKQTKDKMSKQAIITIILGGLMVLSVFGIMFSGYNSGQGSEEYNGHKFKRTQLGWYTEVDGQRAEFTYLPQDLEVIVMDSAVIEKVRRSRVIYLTFNPNSKIVSSLELARFELAKSLAMTMNIQPIPGVLEESDEYDLPVVGCENATALLPVLLFEEGNRTDAYIEGDCIVIETDDYSAVAMKDRLMYGALGIIDTTTSGTVTEEVADDEVGDDPGDDPGEDLILQDEFWETE